MLRRFILTLAASTVIAVGMPSTALAAGLVLVDGHGDMWKDPMGNPTRAPGQDHGDIGRVRVTHAAHQVRVRINVAEVDRSGAGASLSAAVRTNEDVWRRATVYMGGLATRRHPAVSLEFTNRRSELLKCRVGASIGFSSNDVDLTIPRSCLGNPRWVQVSIHTSFADRGGQVFVDNAHNHRAGINAWSPRIRQG